jgi:hypothetical protein
MAILNRLEDGSIVSPGGRIDSLVSKEYAYEINATKLACQSDEYIAVHGRIDVGMRQEGLDGCHQVLWCILHHRYLYRCVDDRVAENIRPTVFEWEQSLDRCRKESTCPPQCKNVVAFQEQYDPTHYIDR